MLGHCRESWIIKYLITRGIWVHKNGPDARISFLLWGYKNSRAVWWIFVTSTRSTHYVVVKSIFPLPGARFASAEWTTAAPGYKLLRERDNSGRDRVASREFHGVRPCEIAIQHPAYTKMNQFFYSLTKLLGICGWQAIWATILLSQ